MSKIIRRIVAWVRAIFTGSRLVKKPVKVTLTRVPDLPKCSNPKCGQRMKPENHRCWRCGTIR